MWAFSNEMDRSLAGAAVYVAVQDAARVIACSRFGDSDCGGTPCWRAHVVLLPQMLLLPACTAMSLRAHGYSLWQLSLIHI